MFLIALPFLAGILSLNLFSELPGNIVYLALLVAITACYTNRAKPFASVFRSIAICLCGICWAQIHASIYLKHVLPENFAGEDIIIMSVGDPDLPPDRLARRNP